MREVSKDWLEMPLIGIAKPRYGKALPARDRIEKGSVAVYGSAGIAGYHNVALVEGPVIIVGRKGNAGEVHLSLGACWPIDTTYFFCVPEWIDPKFLLFQIQHANLRMLDSSTAVPSLRSNDLERVRVRLPDLYEQRQIVAVIEEQFSRLDAADAALRRALARLKTIVDCIFTSALDLRAASYTTLGTIADVVGGVTRDSKRETDPTFIEVPYLRVANVQRGFLDLTEVITVRIDAKKAAKLLLAPGDILFNEGGDRDKLGRGWVWEGQLSPCIHQNHVFRARLTTGAFEPKFISYYGNTIGRTWFERMGKQTTNLASLNLTSLKTFPIPEVSADVQRIVIKEVDRQLSIHKIVTSEVAKALSRSRHLRSAILEDAFCGRLLECKDRAQAVSVP